MNRVSTEKRIAILSALVEGHSIRATCRMTGAAKNTVVKLLCDAGQACERYQRLNMWNLPCKWLQCDEIWSFCYCKSRNVRVGREFDPAVGTVWTWTSICADTRIVPTWLIGGKDAGAAHEFMTDLKQRLANRVQLTTDGRNIFLNAASDALGDDIDYAMLVKMYGPDRDPNKPEAKYSAGVCNGARARAMISNPDPAHVSNSYAERNHLNMRMGMRRFARLTNAFSKKIENLNHAVALHFMHYNFARNHLTLRTTPAQAAGLSDHQWSLAEIIGLIPN